MSKQQKTVRRLKRWLKRKKNLRYITVGALISLIVLLYITMNSSTYSVDTKSLQPLLSLVADAESNGNYNAYFGKPANKSPKFTNMSIRDVQQWQAEYIANGSPSSAVGRYQFLDSTLSSLIAELNIDNNQLFDEKTQDTLAIRLLKRRGATAYVNNELTALVFAANLAKEWASLPSAIGKSPNKSYYAADGLNESRVSVNRVLKAIKAIEPAKL